METKRSVGILLFDSVEVLDFAGPFEVLSIADFNFNAFEVATVAQKPLITARGGLKITPDHIIGSDSMPSFNIIVVPGGFGVKNEVNNEALISWLREAGKSADHVMSVCTGVSLLGKAGLVDQMTVTTHHLCFDEVRQDCAKSKLCSCRRFVDNGKILTSAGISAGIDVSFHLVKKILCVESARKVARDMEYDWKDINCETCQC